MSRCFKASLHFLQGTQHRRVRHYAAVECHKAKDKISMLCALNNLVVLLLSPWQLDHLWIVQPWLPRDENLSHKPNAGELRAHGTYDIWRGRITNNLNDQFQ
jgi:hypothetical protein